MKPEGKAKTFVPSTTFEAENYKKTKRVRHGSSLQGAQSLARGRNVDSYRSVLENGAHPTRDRGYLEGLEPTFLCSVTAVKL